MALASCWECGREISTEAVTCPHCGAPARDVNLSSDTTHGAALDEATLEMEVRREMPAHAEWTGFVLEKLRDGIKPQDVVWLLNPKGLSREDAEQLVSMIAGLSPPCGEGGREITSAETDRGGPRKKADNRTLTATQLTQHSMRQQLPRWNRIVHFVIAVCFLLPFLSFSCMGQKVVTLSGIELATGTSIEPPEGFEGMDGSLDGSREDAEFAGNPFGILAGLSIVLGLLISLGWADARSFLPISGSSAAAALLLVAMKVTVDARIRSETEGMVSGTWEWGFWLTLIALVALASLNAFHAHTTRQ